MIKRVALDGVDEPTRFAGRRNQVVPAPCRQMPATSIDAGDLDGNRIETVEVVQQPAVDAIGRERCLNCRDVEPRRRLKHAEQV